MWLCILKGKQFEDTHESAQWRNVIQMQPMWLCILRPFEDTFENAQWRKVKQMQPMCLCIFSGRQFEDTHAIQKSQKIPVFYFQKSRYRYLSLIPVYRYFPVYRRGLLPCGLVFKWAFLVFQIIPSEAALLKSDAVVGWLPLLLSMRVWMYSLGLAGPPPPSLGGGTTPVSWSRIILMPHHRQTLRSKPATAPPWHRAEGRLHLKNEMIWERKTSQIGESRPH